MLVDIMLDLIEDGTIDVQKDLCTVIYDRDNSFDKSSIVQDYVRLRNEKAGKFSSLYQNRVRSGMKKAEKMFL